MGWGNDGCYNFQIPSQGEVRVYLRRARSMGFAVIVSPALLSLHGGTLMDDDFPINVGGAACVPGNTQCDHQH